jgi:hypothetical protein
MKLLAEQILLASPVYSGTTPPHLELVIPGEVTARPPRLSRPVVLRVLAANTGAAAVADTLKECDPNIRVILDDGTPPAADTTPPTHLMVYLNKSTYVQDGGVVAAAAREALASETPRLLIHENDPTAGGCPFGLFFSTTPQDLISGGLYGEIAVAWQPGAYRPVSCAQAIASLGGEQGRRAAPRVDKLRRWAARALRPRSTPLLNVIGEGREGTKEHKPAAHDASSGGSNVGGDAMVQHTSV